MYANTNLDARENAGKREKIIKEANDNLERHFNEAVRRMYGEQIRAEDEPDWDDPFFAAMRLPYDPKTGEWIVRSEEDGR